MTVIRIPLTEDGIQAAIDQLDYYDMTHLDPAADELARQVAVAVRDRMASDAHVRTGDLKRSINDGPTFSKGRFGTISATYDVRADPTDPFNGYYHYAEAEKTRQGVGSEHDFTRNVNDTVSVSKQAVWESLRSNL